MVGDVFDLQAVIMFVSTIRASHKTNGMTMILPTGGKRDAGEKKIIASVTLIKNWILSPGNTKLGIGKCEKGVGKWLIGNGKWKMGIGKGNRKWILRNDKWVMVIRKWEMRNAN